LSRAEVVSQYRVVQGHASPETKSLINLNSSRVRGPDMKKGHFAALLNAFDQHFDQGAGVAATQVVRMSAHCADLGPAGNPQSLTRHRHQFSFSADAKIIS